MKTLAEKNREIEEYTLKFFCEDNPEIKALSLEYNANVSEEARKLHDEAIVIDSCTFNLEDYGWHIQEAKLTAANCTVPDAGDGMGEAIKKIVNYYQVLHENPDHYVLALKAQDIVDAKKQGKCAVIIGAQNCNFVYHHDIDAAVQVFHRLGLRVMQIAYSSRSFAADGCYTGSNGGITKDGVKMIRAMEKYGVTVDLSHVGERSTLEALEMAEKPMIFSHSNPMAKYVHARNITDEQAKKAAKTGGVIGATPYRITLFNGTDYPTIDDFIDCICYYADLVGVDHVAIGTDSNATAGAYSRQEMGFFIRTLYNANDPNSFTAKAYEMGKGMRSGFIDGMESMANLVCVTDKLLRRGFSHEEVKKILGGNWLRVFEQTW